MIVEHAVKERTVGKVKLKRFSLFFLYIFLALLVLYLGQLLENPIALIFVGGLLIFAIAYLTWPLVFLEFEYSLTGGDLTFSKVYGGRARKRVFTVPIKKLVTVCRYDSEIGQKKLSEFAPGVEYYGISAEDAENIWMCLFDLEDADVTNKKNAKAHAAFYFEMTDKCYMAFRQHNPFATEKCDISTFSGGTGSNES